MRSCNDVTLRGKVATSREDYSGGGKENAVYIREIATWINKHRAICKLETMGLTEIWNPEGEKS